jgi:hypothetical protein
MMKTFALTVQAFWPLKERQETRNLSAPPPLRRTCPRAVAVVA